MPRLSLWKPNKTNDYKYHDNVIKQQYLIGGTALLVHKYIGTEEGGDETTIQDVLFLENRDRKYDKDVYELRGIYQVQDNDFDLSQWGLMLPNDMLFISVHTNHCVDILGRKIMNGDVIELPHLRDDLLLDPDAPAINKFFKVEDVNREASGFSQTWWSHTLRVKIKPLEDSQEYRAIVGDESGSDSVFDVLSTYQSELDLNYEWMKNAHDQVPHRNFETQQFYIVKELDDPHGPLGTQYAWIFAGDSEPPNGQPLAYNQGTFPTDPQEGEYLLHTGYQPNMLFQYCNNKWIRLEIDFKRTWVAASRELETFINNRNVTTFNDGSTQMEKQGLSKAMTRRDGGYNMEDWSIDLGDDE